MPAVLVFDNNSWKKILTQFNHWFLELQEAAKHAG